MAEIVLGINFGGHDTSAALMIDGELVAACEQERYSRDKHCRRFPTQAAYDCLNLAQIEPEKVKEIAFGFDFVHHLREAYLRPALSDDERLSFMIRDIERIKEKYNTKDTVRKHLPFCEKIRFYSHHECHLASTYFPSGFEDSLVVSYDGIGEIESGIFAHGSKRDIDIIHRDNRYPDSLGLLYSAFTDFLGWKHHCDEGIVMGLATYGDPNAVVPGSDLSYIELLRRIVVKTGTLDYQIDRSWITFHRERDSWVSSKFKEHFGQKRRPDGEITPHHMNLAAALQTRLEEIVLDQLRSLRDQFESRYLCLSGGVALNCSLNGKIEQERIFDEIFVQPASGDAGIAIGACYLAHKHLLQGRDFSRAKTAYLGSEFSNDEIEEAFGERGLTPEKPADIFQLTARKLNQGKIIGWFQGRAEFGPRALGNRSILTRPFPAEMKDYLNARVKFRESFRPFAPAVLEEYAQDYFSINQSSPHMLIACQATPLGKDRAPATVHVDNSSRVQTVTPEDNPRFHRLISSFLEESGCPIVLNTSFNVKGQPIVNNPGEAIDCFLGTNIDFLVVGDFVIEK